MAVRAKGAEENGVIFSDIREIYDTTEHEDEVFVEGGH